MILNDMLPLKEKKSEAIVSDNINNDHKIEKRISKTVDRYGFTS